MRRSGVFWGTIILILGIMLLLQTLGIISVSVWTIFWPLFLIALGVWFLFSSRWRRGTAQAENLSIPRDGASQASIEFHHGAGKLDVGSLMGGTALLEGTFVGGVSHTAQPFGSEMRVRLSADPVHPWGPWNWPEGLRWDVRLTQDLPLQLVFHTGAGESDINLADLNVKSLRLETGASSTRVILPARAQYTRVDAKAGMAAVNMTVPQGVAAMIQAKTGLAGVTIDTNRFPQQGSTYVSPDFGTAPNKVEIYIEGGMGSFDVR